MAENEKDYIDDGTFFDFLTVESIKDMSLKPLEGKERIIFINMKSDGPAGDKNEKDRKKIKNLIGERLESLDSIKCFVFEGYDFTDMRVQNLKSMDTLELRNCKLNKSEMFLSRFNEIRISKNSDIECLSINFPTAQPS